MKRSTLVMLLSSVIVLPLLFHKLRQRLPLFNNENLRYDTEDLITDEAL